MSICDNPEVQINSNFISKMYEAIFCNDNFITDQKQLRDRTQHADVREANFHPII